MFIKCLGTIEKIQRLEGTEPMLRLIDKDSDHMSLSRSVAFLIDGQPLGPKDRRHLFRCEDCMKSAVDAVSEEMEKRLSLLTWRCKRDQSV